MPVSFFVRLLSAQASPSATTAASVSPVPMPVKVRLRGPLLTRAERASVVEHQRAGAFVVYNTAAGAKREQAIDSRASTCVLQRAAVDHNVGGAAGRGTDIAGQTAVGQCADLQQTAAGNGGDTRVGVLAPPVGSWCRCRPWSGCSYHRGCCRRWKSACNLC